jgi:hypothetical protein
VCAVVTLSYIYVPLFFETPHKFGAVTADARLTHPSEDGFATPIDNPQVQGVTIAQFDKYLSVEPTRS